VIQVLEIRQAGELTFEDVRDQIRQVLQDQQFQDQLYERLRSESHIEIRW
jgi:parvulin-like peptidyl-prolyl isomerase